MAYSHQAKAGAHPKKIKEQAKKNASPSSTAAVCRGGGVCQWGGECLEGFLPRGVYIGDVHLPSPVDRILDTYFCKHYLSTTSFADGKKKNGKHQRQFSFSHSLLPDLNRALESP